MALPQDEVCPHCVEYSKLCRAWTEDGDRSVRCLREAGHVVGHLSDGRAGRYVWVPEGWNPFH